MNRLFLALAMGQTVGETVVESHTWVSASNFLLSTFRKTCLTLNNNSFTDCTHYRPTIEGLTALGALHAHIHTQTLHLALSLPLFHTRILNYLPRSCFFLSFTFARSGRPYSFSHISLLPLFLFLSFLLSPFSFFHSRSLILPSSSHACIFI